MPNICPVCRASNIVSTVTRNNLVTMQNYIYRSLRESRAANVGEFEICVCGSCGLGFNARYDSSLVNYDENYNVYIPSAIFNNYYAEIATFLYDKFSLKNGLVIDIACGKGTFLEVLCGMYRDVQGLGIDPSFEANDSNDLTSNLQFIKDVFKEEYIKNKPSLIMCRHAFEQIEHPLEFLQSIRGALREFDSTPFFIEVADLEEIVVNNAFWDLCYERCSYWTADSLKNTLGLAGFQTENVRRASGGQYLWAFGTITQDRSINPVFEEIDAIGERLTAYSLTEKNLIGEMKHRLQNLKAEGNTVAVWGMATKGVVFCNLIDAENQLIDYCIDISGTKKRCFVAHTGHQINAPDILREVCSKQLVIIVMNPNYLTEISEICKRLGLSPKYVDASGNNLMVE